MELSLLELILTFLGGGAITTMTTYLIQRKQEQRKEKQIELNSEKEINQRLFNDLYKELGRVQERLERAEKKNDELEKENDELKEENLQLRHLLKGYEDLKIKYDKLEKEYGEIKNINNELLTRIDSLLNKEN